MNEHRPGPVQAELTSSGERLVVETFPLPPLLCLFITLLGICLLMLIPWALKGWQLPLGSYTVRVPGDSVTIVIVIALLAGGSVLAFGLAGLAQVIGRTRPTIFDREAGVFWRGWRTQPPRNAQPLSSIRALRLHRGDSYYYLTLDLDYESITLASDENGELVALPARQLAEFLSVPLAGRV